MQALSFSESGMHGLSRFNSVRGYSRFFPQRPAACPPLIPITVIFCSNNRKSVFLTGGSMSRSSFGRIVLSVVIAMMVMATTTTIWGQSTQGKVDVTVLDQKNAYVAGARIVLRDVVTNTERTADSQNAGTYSFVNLPLGKYKLTISKDGFETASYDVEVEVTKTTSVSATLKVGSVKQVIEVGAAAPILDTTSNNIGSVINPKDIEELPLFGRNLTALSVLSPGYTGTPGGNGTWNGLPSIAQGNNVDGVMGSPSRMKFGGNAGPDIVQVRLENIEEMTIQTDSLDLNQGFGQSAMQVNFTTRRGGNDFHGRAFEDFRNSYLNANSWRNNASGLARPRFELNEFGFSAGGHIIKDKLFFFGSFSTFQQPASVPVSRTVLTAAAQAGNFTYAVPAGTCTAGSTTCTVNLFTVAAASGLPSTVNSVIAAQLGAINTVTTGSVTATTDPIINSLNFITPAPVKQYFPTFRIDYDATKKIRVSLAYNETYSLQPVANSPFFPGTAFATTGAGNKNWAYPASLGIEWTISPTLVNQFNGGFLYWVSSFGYNTSSDYKKAPWIVGWPLVTSPQQYNLPVTPYYPVFNASDTMSWQRRSHALSFGFSYYHEQDHYWNPPEGITNISLGLVNGDPALTPFTGTTNLPGANTNEQAEAQQLYALLTGRISGTFVRNTILPDRSGYTSAVTEHPLDEIAQAWGLFAQDSWRVRPNLTFNYGLRWDFTAATKDISFGGLYHNANLSSILGPTPLGDLFHPGVLSGNLNPSIDTRPQPYNNWNVAPQPMFGFAWQPQFKNAGLSKVAGSGTVIRAGFSL